MVLEASSWLVLAWGVVASLVAFVVAGYDKRAAGRGKRRVRESTLQLWAWLGGGLGGFVAFRVWRHKTRKASFMVPYVVAAVAGWAVLGFLVWWFERA